MTRLGSWHASEVHFHEQARLRIFLTMILKMERSAKGRLTLAQFEQDDSPKQCEENRFCFLKLSGKRLGRDLNFYLAMARMGSWMVAMTEFMNDVILPCNFGSLDLQVITDLIFAATDDELPSEREQRKKVLGDDQPPDFTMVFGRSAAAHTA